MNFKCLGLSFRWRVTTPLLHSGDMDGFLTPLEARGQANAVPVYDKTKKETQTSTIPVWAVRRRIRTWLMASAFPMRV
jgi:hypothetical protein